MPLPVPQVDCASGNDCAALNIGGDAPASNAGNFRGFADPAIAQDPQVPGRVWLAYSWPHVVSGTAPNGAAVQMAAVGNRLARSDDGGASFDLVDELWPDFAAADPEGSGENGIISSETASLASISSGGTTIWYGAHLRYFLEPKTGYNPKFATSWHVRIGAASSPEALATATETVLGVSTTAAAYQPAVRLDQLAGLPIQHCALLNNPTLFTQDGTLYLIVECLAFVGTSLDVANSSIQVFATAPSGAPRSWSWRYAGRLAGDELARELGRDTIQQPDVSLAADGAPLLIVTPADDEDPAEVGTEGAGCVALELRSLDPPALQRDDSGRTMARARITGSRLGACTHDRQSVSGIVVTAQDSGGGNWRLRASQLRP